MPVNLKQIPAPAPQPELPKWWLWLLLLLGGCLVGTAWAILNNQGKSVIDAAEFWETALVFPALIWMSLLLVRIVWYRGVQATADGSNEVREQILQHQIQRGRRCLAVLDVSLRTALREHGDRDGQMQRKALQSKNQALRTQASWQSDEGKRHSRLALIDDETPEQLMSRELSDTLEEMSHALASVPADIPLTVLVESNSRLSQRQIQLIWHRCWAASQIRQPVTYIEGRGLEVVDEWLDGNMDSRAMLLIVAVQVAPEEIEGTAEVVVGLLLRSHPQEADSLKPLALLHRPERMHGMSNEDFHYALERALDWVPIQAKDVSGGWLVGVNAKWNQAIATGLMAMSSPVNVNIGQDLYNLDTSLGYPGPAAPWSVIACAVEHISEGKPQLTISGEGVVDRPLWVTMVTSASEIKS